MSAHGGARPGSGRKPGGANKIDQESREAALAGGISPLDYMLSVMRNESNDEGRRLDAAKAAAPYLHARLTSMEHSGAVGLLTHEQFIEDLT